MKARPVKATGFWLAGMLLVLALALTACGPEAARVRGGDAGADTGNVGTPVQLHSDADISDRIYPEADEEG